MKTLIVYSEVSGFAIQIKNHIFSALKELSVETKECYIEQVSQASEAFQPTMHLFLHHGRKLYEHLDQIKQLKGHKMLWTMEDPYESDVTFDMLPHFYYIFTSDENTSFALKKAEPDHKIFFVPHACNPKVHKPMDITYEYRSDICFIGNAFPSRLKWFQEHAKEYKNKKVTIIGVGYRGLDGYQHQRIIHDHVHDPDAQRYINGATLVLNLHRQNEDLDMANKRNIVASSFNNRYYETWACGRPQLVIGRGNQFYWKEKYRTAHKFHSYKQRLVDYYIPLLNL